MSSQNKYNLRMNEKEYLREDKKTSTPDQTIKQS